MSSAQAIAGRPDEVSRSSARNLSTLCRVKAALVETQEAAFLLLCVDSALVQWPGSQKSSGTTTAGRCP